MTGRTLRFGSGRSGAFVGDKVAAVARSIDAPKKLKLIDVEYEELPAIFDPLEATESNAICSIRTMLPTQTPSASRGAGAAQYPKASYERARRPSIQAFSRIGQSIRAYLPHPDGSSSGLCSSPPRLWSTVDGEGECWSGRRPQSPFSARSACGISRSAQWIEVICPSDRRRRFLSAARICGSIFLSLITWRTTRQTAAHREDLRRGTDGTPRRVILPSFVCAPA